MVKKGKRMSGIPILVKPNKELAKPRRIEFGEKTFDEDWLQGLIYDNPDLLPIDEIEPIFSPLISIGREFPTDAGSIDNIFISPSGYITIVEAKLWRNPEARREVVGQILDYAKELSGWSYEEFDEKVQQLSSKNNKEDRRSIIELINQVDEIESSQESKIIDNISRNLQKGQFLLLIVGDGIREEVEAMVDYLNQTPQLHFSLAMIELQVYEIDENNGLTMLVVPQVVARTSEITRAIVTVEGKEISKITIAVDTPATESGTKPGKRFRLTENEFFKILKENVEETELEFARQILEDAEEGGFQVDWMQANCVLKYRDPENSDIAFTVLLVNKEGTVAPGYLLGSLREDDSFVAESKKFVKKTAELFEGVKPGKDTETWDTPVTLYKFKSKYDDYMLIVDGTIKKLKWMVEKLT